MAFGQIAKYVKHREYHAFDDDKILSEERLAQGMRMLMWSEYKHYHHETFKLVYQAFEEMPEESIPKQIEIVLEREKSAPYTGGIQAAAMNAEIMIEFGFKEEGLREILRKRWLPAMIKGLRMFEGFEKDGGKSRCSRTTPIMIGSSSFRSSPE